MESNKDIFSLLTSIDSETPAENRRFEPVIIAKRVFFLVERFQPRKIGRVESSRWLPRSVPLNVSVLERALVMPAHKMNVWETQQPMPWVDSGCWR